jgi:hypothetical protein
MSNDTASSARAIAAELQNRYKPQFEEAGGTLEVRSARASNIRDRTKSVTLSASVTWDAERLYDHIDVDLKERRWFSRKWRDVHSVEEAQKLIVDQMENWLNRIS